MEHIRHEGSTAGTCREQGPGTLAEVAERYQGRLLERGHLSEYEEWALTLFHDQRVVRDPSVSVSLRLDIKGADDLYQRRYASVAGSSFTGYLTWKLLVALQRHPCLNWRCLNGEWYEFDNLPLFFPVAVDGPFRFQDALVEDVAHSDWPTFCERYSWSLAWARGATHRWGLTAMTWSVATFIGNLPYLDFQSLTIPSSNLLTARPVFYFGRRTGTPPSTVPLAVTMDHSNADPLILDRLLGDYQELLVTE